MAVFSQVYSGELHVGAGVIPPVSTATFEQSLDPTKPFSIHNFGIHQGEGVQNQIGLYNGLGVWNELGVYNGIGQGIFLGGHQDAQPYYDSSSPTINYSSPDGNLFGNWVYNGSTICAPCPSDERAKTNVKDLTNCLDKVLKLRGVSFEWNSEVVPQKSLAQSSSIGLIAQEVEKVVPELVVEERIENQNLKTVEYGNLTALLIEAVREQQSQIEELKQTVQELSKRLDQALQV
jgi:hypothetical protein